MPAVVSLMQESIYFLVFVSLLLGLFAGSFINVVAHRLPIMMGREWRRSAFQTLYPDQKPEPEEETTYNLFGPRSGCPVCRQPIRAADNIPVISYLLLRGRCRSCQVKIPLHYPVVELIAGLLAMQSAWHFGFGWQALCAALFGFALLSLSVIDWEHQLLPDDITIPWLWLGLIINLFGIFATISDAVAGAIGGYMILWLLYQAHYRLTGREGLGYGDFKLLALIGAWQGWAVLPCVLLIASLAGLVFTVASVLLYVCRRPGERSFANASAWNQPMAFGPYLAIAGWFCLLGDDWLSVFGLRLGM